jgi:hypothetical protein
VLEDGVNARLVPPGGIDRLAAAPWKSPAIRTAPCRWKRRLPVPRTMRDVAHDTPLYTGQSGSDVQDQRAGRCRQQSLLTPGDTTGPGRTFFPGVAVLCYHGVRDNTLAQRAIPLQDLHIRTSTFASHLSAATPVSLARRPARRQEGQFGLPERPV